MHNRGDPGAFIGYIGDMDSDARDRFSNRVADYIASRPSYPAELFETLEETGVLHANTVAVEVGAGTGIFSRLLAPRLRFLYCVEPNDSMRQACARTLSGVENTVVLPGDAESTGLESHCVTLYTAAQSFHWFDIRAARAEALRILTADTHALLVWNERETGSTPFLHAYEALIERHAIDYREVNHTQIGRTQLEAFFGNNDYAVHAFDNLHYHDLKGLEARLASSSYMPSRTASGYKEMVDDLAQLFSTYQEDGHVAIRYRTRGYLGRVV